MKNPTGLWMFPAISIVVIYSCTKPANSVLLPVPSIATVNGYPSGNSNSGNSAFSNLPSDVRMARCNLNLAFNDVNFALGLSSPGKKITSNQFILCGAKMDSSNFHSKGILLLNYDGTTECGPDQVLRSGQISITTPLNNSWDSAGSTCTLGFVNYKVTNNSTDKSITINGIQTITNTSGGLVASFSGLPVVFRIQGLPLSVTFNDSIQRIWNLRITRTIIATGNASLNTLTVSEQGDTSLNGVANTAFWGTTKSGAAFSTSVNRYTANSNCGFRNPTGGTEVFALDSNRVTVTYGVTPAGNPVTSGCAFGYKEVWKNSAGLPQTIVFRY